MTALQLHKFIQDNKVEYHWTDKKDVVIFVEFDNLKELSDLLGYTYTSEGTFKGVLIESHVCFHIAEACEKFDIYLEEIFTEKD